VQQRVNELTLMVNS